ncbi:MAG: YceI family protein [Chloroflexi bacterium]|nr:YceI family protein [Chloroflexota bacterium]
MLSLPRLIGALAVAVVLAAAAGAGWWFFLREDNELATSAPAVPAELKQTPAAVATGGGLAFNVIPERSEAAYFADEKLASLPLPSTAKGVTKDIEGVFYLAADGLTLDPSRPSQFTVNLKTLKSDKDMRDGRVQGQGLETEKYPTATFTVTKVTGYDAAKPAGEEQTLQLTGAMDLHGVQKELTWEAKARREGNVITALATVNFKYADFNIPVLNIAGIVSVQDNVTLQVQIVAQAG